MDVRNESALLDATLSALVPERGARSDLCFTPEHHALTGAAYHLGPVAREDAFQQIHRRLFRRR